MEMMKEVDEYFERAEYSAIAKTNLFPCGMCPRNNRKGNLVMAAHVLTESVVGKKVILLGNEVRNAVMGEELGKKTPSAKFVKLHRSLYAWIPHPSGRNHFYNDTRNRRKIGRFLNKARRNDYPR